MYCCGEAVSHLALGDVSLNLAHGRSYLEQS